MKQGKLKAILAAFALTFTVQVLLFGPTFVRKGVDTVYQDHQSLVRENKGLEKKLDTKPEVATKEIRVPAITAHLNPGNRQPRQKEEKMIYIPTKKEKDKAEIWLNDLRNSGLEPSTIPLAELLAMYAKEVSF